MRYGYPKDALFCLSNTTFQHGKTTRHMVGCANVNWGLAPRCVLAYNHPVVFLGVV
ncbi:hypothetical protein BC777_0068 [Yoonia maricola]|uniref:Uncharacterized protein n=1 Tax=Yoonia maricola TaxID=420999 RepID=A0A2M8WJY9_9RHOB|nr:hypothetical protein BC777_0068 [Yoonia maricola]